MSTTMPVPLETQGDAGSLPATAVRPSEVTQERDLAFDLLRGIAVMLMVVTHIERQSLFSLLAWERLGMVSSAECFVLLSGIVVGMVSLRRAVKKGAAFADASLYQRAFQLYRVNVVLVILVMALSAIPSLDVSALTTFVDRSSGQVWPTYPKWSDAFWQITGQLALLRAGSHQVQILGLYVCLVAMAPLGLRLMRDGRTSWLIGGSWLAYIYQQVSPSMPTGMRFEYAFPVLAWQVLFIHGLCVGYHRDAVVAWLDRRAGRALLVFAAIFATACFALAQFTPNPFVPSWARATSISASTFNGVRDAWFAKNALGPGRLANDVALLLVAWWVVSRTSIAKAPSLRWLVATGQASLYVFIVHSLVVLLASWVLPPNFVNEPPMRLLLQNSALHFACMAAIVLAVHKRFLFSVIPR